MKLYLPSMSGLERASICPASQVFPHRESRRGGLWQSRGNILHPFLANVPKVGREAALDLVPFEFRAACEVVDLELLETMKDGAFAQEVSFAIDIYAGTGRELGRGLSREQAYALAKPHELVGTVDVIGLTEDAVVVYDYKTGYRFFDVIERNWQLLGYALGAALAYERGHAYLAIIRVPEHGEPYFIRGEVTFADLDRGLEALRALNDEIAELRLRYLAGERLHLVTGEHCKFCPAVADCPAIAKLQRRLTSPKGLRLPPLDEKSAPQYLEALRRGTLALEDLKARLNAYAAQHPFDIGDGWVYGPRPHPQDHINVAKALPLLEQLLDGEAALECVKETRAITKERLEDAIRNLKKRRKGVTIKKWKAKVLNRLKESGALTTTYTYPVGEHKAPPPGLTEGAANGEGEPQEVGAAEGDPPGEADAG